MKPKKTRFRRIVARLLRGDLMRGIAEDEGTTVAYISKVRSRAGILRRVQPKIGRVPGRGQDYLRGTKWLR